MGNVVSALTCRKREVPQTDTAIDGEGYEFEAQAPILPIRREPGTLPCGCPSNTETRGASHSHGAQDFVMNMGSDIVPRFQPILHIEPVGPLKCNMVIVGDPVTKEVVLVDPGGDFEVIVGIIEKLQVKVLRILVTHAHFDHFLAAGMIRQHTGAPVYLHPKDKILWNFLPMQLKMLNIAISSELFNSIGSPDHDLQDNDELGVLDGKCLHTPGHTPGSCSFYFPESKLLLSGDTLFNGSVGRTDLLGGNQEDLIKSIRDKLYILPDAVAVIPGHGPKTTIGKEKHTNAVVREVTTSSL